MAVAAAAALVVVALAEAAAVVWAKAQHLRPQGRVNAQAPPSAELTWHENSGATAAALLFAVNIEPSNLADLLLDENSCRQHDARDGSFHTRSNAFML